MGKKQHSKDQLYLTNSESSAQVGRKQSNFHIPYKTLPFDCCAISFRPFETPMCTADGVVFDLLNIVPYLKKFRRHPVTGAPLAATDLIRLQFHKNGDGKYHCPVTFKVFNQHTHIVAIKQTGNVYAYDAVRELNIKAKCMRDLLDDTPFARADVITIQDPSDGSAREIERFSHVKEDLSAAAVRKDDNVRHSDATSRVMSQLTKGASSSSAAASSSAAKASSSSAAASSSSAAAPGGAPPKAAKPAPPRWQQTTSAHAAGFTSTALTPVTSNEIAPLSDDEVRRQRYAYLKAKKKKAYAQLQTSHGNLNLELHCDAAPMAVDNFITLCGRNYYDGVPFHRLIRNFMVQGGDPTGTGTGGESAWGAPFKDEISNKWKHDGRGVLSMANSGPTTNGSQFFFTFKSCAHLDGKHTVFGRVVGGLDTLAKMERVAADKDDRPQQPITITGAAVFSNPFDGLDDEIAAAHAADADPLAAKAAAAAKRQEEDAQAWYNVAAAAPKPVREGVSVGRFMKLPAWSEPAAAAAAERAAPAAAAEADAPPPKKAKRAAGGFGDFSGW